jgi:2-polyprenyl-6-methoxyphenol hydroxylase-like FAD-dependent oxidoreductase
VGEPNLGYIVENRSLAAAGLRFCRTGRQVWGARIGGLRWRGAVRLRTSEASGARLVIGADGAHPRCVTPQDPLRTHDYRQSAVVADIEGTRPHRHTAWAVSRFSPLALLPLFSGSSSLSGPADSRWPKN